MLTIKVTALKGALRNFSVVTGFFAGTGKPASRQFVLTRPMKASRFLQEKKSL